ncbi:MAG: protein kinase, partial [Deltaproteobacteria bacterium]|nr:protein kinase [Deltaproteobacteria bacterium]
MAEGPQGAAGRRLGGRYRLLWPLGSGGAATVWAARDELLGVDRAVKLLTVEPGERAEALRQRLRVEARTMAGLRHPHILRVLDLGEDGAQDFVVMDLAPRGALSARLAAEGPLPLPELLKVGAQLCGALAAAHAAGVV